MNQGLVKDLGCMPYAQAWDLQKTLFNNAIQQKLNHELPTHHLLMCEHPHVYTMGKSADAHNLLASPSELAQQQIEVFEIERGGDITYHGPGQLVVYPIFDLEQLGIGVKAFVEKVEQCIIDVLQSYGIQAERIADRIGIWIDKGSANERKIAAIGIKCSRHITMHGLAFNINTDLSLFNQIIPCGIVNKGVSSLAHELGRQISMTDIKKDMLSAFSRIFEIQFIHQDENL